MKNQIIAGAVASLAGLAAVILFPSVFGVLLSAAVAMGALHFI